MSYNDNYYLSMFNAIVMTEMLNKAIIRDPQVKQNKYDFLIAPK